MLSFAVSARSRHLEIFRTMLATLALIAVALPAMPAWSGGIGGNFTFGSSEGEVDDTDDFFPNINSSADLFEIGISYDTNLAANRLINYRLNANVVFVEQQLNQGATKVDIDGSGFALNQLIGFGLVRTPKIRVFVGPTIHLGIVGFDDNDRVSGTKINYEELLFTAGIGPEVGMNYHLGRNLTMSISGHYRYGFQLQGFDNPFTTSSSSDRVFVGHEHRVGITTALYFRFSSDQYKARVKKKRRIKQKPSKPDPAAI